MMEEKLVAEPNTFDDDTQKIKNNHDANKTTKPKTVIKMVIKVVVVFAIVFSTLSLLLYCIFIGVISNINKDTPKVEDYQSYIENKYGADKGFYYVEKGNCNWFETGSCSYLFSSNELNGARFSVWSEREYNGNNQSTKYVFGDNYDRRKELEALKPQYYNFLEDVIPYNYDLELRDDYFVRNWLNLEILVKYNDIPSIEEINPTTLKESIISAIPQQYLKNIDIEFTVVIYAGSGVSYGYLERCPEFFDSGSYASSKPESANSCTISIK